MPFDPIRCSLPRPVEHQNGYWLSGPDWDAPAMPVAGGSEVIGVASLCQTHMGLVVGPKKPSGTPRSERGKEQFNKLLEAHGYERTEGVATDSDHVVELQVSGPDATPNVWPLSSKVNQPGGTRLNNFLVTIEDGSQKRVKELEGKFFKIVAFDA